jgi:CDP-6-deoxy-D-xylo-4-hexulose-3-dehydrase
MAQNKFNWQLINDNINMQDKLEMISFISSPDVRFTNGPKVREFESIWSDWLGVKHTTFVNSGASANYIMMSVVKEIKGSGEVIVPPLGWVSDISPVVNLGMTPVFVDVDPETLCIGYDNIVNAVTDETVAIVLVHALGFNDMEQRLVDFAKERGIILIEDCCEAHGATYNGKKVGSFGDMSNFSFYFGHHITTIEGGTVSTNNDLMHEYIRLFRSHGMTREASQDFQSQYVDKYPDLNPLFTFAVPGYNMRNSEINAVLGINQMKRIDYNIQRRIDNFDIWNSNLDSNIYFTDYTVEGNSNFALPLVLREENKERFQDICNILEEEKVEYRTGTAGGGNQALQPYLVEGKYEFRIHNNLDYTDHIHHSSLYIGNHPELEEQQIINLCKRLNNV